MSRMYRSSFQFPFENGETIKENAYVALADTSHTVRRHYNLIDEEDTKLLVKHITSMVL